MSLRRTPSPNQKRTSRGYVAFALFLALICAVYLIVGAHAARAGTNVWTTQGPYGGGSVRALAIDPTTPSTLYAGTARGVFQSTDSGASWTAVNSGLVYPVNGFINALAIDPHTPSRLYVGGSACSTGIGCGGWVFQSINKSAGWSAAGYPEHTTGGGDSPVTALAVDPLTPSTLYAGTNGSGVFQSTDSGTSWTAVNIGLNGNALFVRPLAMDPTMPSTLYAGSTGVFQSTDSGGSWTAVNTGLPSDVWVTALAIDPTTPSTLYAGIWGYYPVSAAGVYRSTDGGATWTAVETDLTETNVRALAINPSIPSTLYTGTGRGVFQSTNSGASWAAINTGLTNTDVHALAIDPMTPSTVYAGTDSGFVFDIELTCFVGTGTAESCAESALDACLPGGAGFTGAIAFNCGASPVTITVKRTKTIPTNTSIDGGGLITLSGGGKVQVFVVNEGVTLDLHGLIVSGASSSGAAIDNNGTLAVTGTTFYGNSCAIDNSGILRLTNSIFSENKGDYVGGAIYNSGILAVANSTFSGNHALLHGAIYNAVDGTLTVTESTFSGNNCPSEGGAILNHGTLTVTNSTFSNNASDNHGGAILNDGTLSVTGSTFSENSAPYGSAIENSSTLTLTNSIFSGNHGVAIYNVGGALTVTNSTLSGNAGPGAAGILNNQGTLTVTNSTFSANTGRLGAAIANSGNLTVTNSTFFINTAGDTGGAIYSVGTLTVTNSTFSSNTTYQGGGAISAFGTTTFTNTIIADSRRGRNCAGTITDGGHNLDSDGTCGVGPATAPLLAEGLADNGGPTQTIALRAGSPAIDAGDPAACAAAPVNRLGQRGYVRPGVGYTNCSIGAYEFDSPGPFPCVGDCTNDGHATVDEILTLVNITLGSAEMSECEIGDANNDGQITVDEILRAVNYALNGCPLAPEAGCLGSGGTLTTATCCVNTSDFPDSCAIGACGCPPDASHTVRVCDCAAGSCFNRTRCVGK